MNNFPNKKDRIIVLVLWLIFFTTAVSYSLFLLAFQDIGTIITAVISISVTIFLTVLIKKVSKGYFLKYYFNKKKYNELLKESLEKFKDADEEFIKEFKRRTLAEYYTTGKLFYVQTIEDDKWILSSKDNLAGLVMLINILETSINNKLGFNFFIDESYKLAHDGELVIRTLSNGFLSGELKYLLFIVYLNTDFNLEDNGLNSEYTKRINDLREELNKRYSPLLFSFLDEIQYIKDKLMNNNEKLIVS